MRSQFCILLPHAWSSAPMSSAAAANVRSSELFGRSRVRSALRARSVILKDAAAATTKVVAPVTLTLRAAARQKSRARCR